MELDAKAEAATMEVPIKMQCAGGHLRRVRLVDPGLADVVALVQRWVPGGVLQYADDEGDVVTVETDDEWRECLALWRATAAPGALRLSATRLAPSRAPRAAPQAAPAMALVPVVGVPVRAGAVPAAGVVEGIVASEADAQAVQAEVVAASADGPAEPSAGGRRRGGRAHWGMLGNVAAAVGLAREHCRRQRAERWAAWRAAATKPCEGCGVYATRCPRAQFCCRGCKHGGDHSPKCHRVPFARADASPPAGPDAPAAAAQGANAACEQQLRAMGFAVTDEVRALVSQHNGDVDVVVAALL